MKTKKLVNIVTLVFALILNGLASTLPLNGRDTGQISDMYPTLFTPAGYVFSIWGLIYLGLIALVVFGATNKGDAITEKLGFWFAASSVLNGLWIVAWHYDWLLLSLFLMLGILASLIAAYERLGIGRTAASGAETWLVRVPISIYLGWISVATIANVSVLSYANGWGGWGISPTVWTVIMVLVGGLLNALMIWRRREVAYGLVYVWAGVGIAVANGFGSVVGIVALIVAIAVAALVLLRLIGRFPKASASA